MFRQQRFCHPRPWNRCFLVVVCHKRTRQVTAQSCAVDTLDLLHFEKVRSYRRTACRHDPLGVEKTAFLNHAIHIWEETRFDRSIYTDIGKERCQIGRRLLSTHNPAATRRRGRRPGRRLFRRVALHLSWVTAKHTDTSVLAKATPEFADVVRTLLGAGEPPSYRGQTCKSTYRVCVSRHSHRVGRLESVLGVSFDRERPGLYGAAPGPSCSDPVDLAHGIFSASRTATRATTQGCTKNPIEAAARLLGAW